MSGRGVLVAAFVAALIGLGAFLWSRQGALVWLQGAIRTCF